MTYLNSQRWCLCRHKWNEVYRLKKGTELKDGQSLDNDYNKVDSIPASYKKKTKRIKRK